MRTRPSSASPAPPERRGGSRPRGSHARAPERSPAKTAAAMAAPRPVGARSGGGQARNGSVRARTGSRSTAGAWQRARVWHGPRTVRAKVVALLMVPIISLMALWGLAAVSTAQNMSSLQQLRTVDTDVRQPIESMISALQLERSAAMRLLSEPGAKAVPDPDQTGYQADFAATDGAQAGIRTGSEQAAAALNNLGSDTRQRIDTLLGGLGSLTSLRHQVADGEISVSTAYSVYCSTIDDGFAVEGSLATLQDDAVGSNAQSVLQLAQAGEMLARQDSVLNAAFSAGRISPADYQEFVGAAYSQNLLQIDAARALRPVDRAAYQRVVTSAAYLLLLRDQTDVLKFDAGPTASVGFSPADWVKPEAATLSGLTAVATAAGTAAVARIDPYTGFLGTPQGIAVLVGLVAVLLSLLVSVRIGRGLVLELVGLRDTALDLARRRLPRAIARLRAGQSVDVDVEAPPAVQVDDEIGQVSEALAAAARAAIQAAVERAEVVSAVAGVFLNLARRSQLLVHRQLALLDTMERRNEDPDELEDLFRLDHLATRMRRHAEGLIILSGAAPGRGWRKPVPLMDVLRAAVAEVEDYARVDVRRLELVHLTGAAVADLTHLIAELVENATVFSPPHTRVQVRGEQVGSGFAIDIEDRGLGMGEQAIAEANQRIANADQTDLFDSDRLGLFVVSRLARRHSIQVTVGRSAYGGTTAVVLLPKALLENTAAGTFSQAEAGYGQAAGSQAAEAGASSGASSGSNPGSYGPGAAKGGSAVTGSGSANGAGSGSGAGSAGRAGGEPILIGAPAGPRAVNDSGAAGGVRESGAAVGQGSAERKANGVPHLNGFYRQLSDLEPDRPPVPARPLPGFEPGGPGPAEPGSARRASGGPDSADSDAPTPAGPAPADPAGRGDSPVRPQRSESDSGDGPRNVRPPTSQPSGFGPNRSPGSDPAGPEPSWPSAAAQPSTPAPASGTSAQSAQQLPRRVRQASLAPQLRHKVEEPDELASTAGSEPATPERARATMTAFQRGWTLGRTGYTAAAPDGPSAGAPAAPAAEGP